MTYRLPPEKMLDMAEARLRGASVAEIARVFCIGWDAARAMLGRLVPETFEGRK